MTQRALNGRTSWQWSSLLGALSLCPGCGQDAGPRPPLDPLDAGTEVAIMPEAPTPPSLLPCPEGWSQVGTSGGPITCEPWPEGGPSDCAPDEAHFPGEPGCVRIGSACPAAGGFADALPSDTFVIYVQDGALDGIGTRDRPYGTLDEGLLHALPGSIVALSPGEYVGELRLARGITLWGACAGTVIRSAIPSDTSAVLIIGGVDTAVRNLRIGASPRAGILLAAETAVHLEDVIVEHVTGAGIQAGGRSSVTANRLVVRDTESTSAGLEGRGVNIMSGATAEIHHAVFERNRNVGVAALNHGTMVLMRDVSIRDTLGQRLDGEGGRGVAAQGGAALDMARSVIERQRIAGIVGSLAGTRVVLDQVVIRDTLGTEPGGVSGRGLEAYAGAELTARRISIERNRDVGILVLEGPSSATLTDVVIRDTQTERAEGNGGRGIEVAGGGQLEGERIWVERNREVGVSVSDLDTLVEIENLFILQTRESELDERFGRGLNVQLGATVRLQRARIEQSRQNGVAAIGPGTTVHLEEAWVHQVLEQACADTSCPDLPFGMGVGSYSGASIRVSGFRITDAALCGVHVDGAASVDLSRGAVGGSDIGACVQVDGYDVSRLSEDVRYHDNRINLDATRLPVPDPVGMRDRPR